MKKINSQKAFKAAAAVISVLLVLSVSFYATYSYFSHKQSITKASPEGNNKSSDTNAKPNTAVPVEKPIQQPKTSEIILTSVGDCTLGTDDKFSVSVNLPTVFKKQNSDYNYFFKNVASYFKQDSITIANLETTLTNSNGKVSKPGDVTYNFKGSPDYAKALTAASIEAVNLSNNHIYDYGKQGFDDTISALKAESVGYFGENNKWIKDINGVKVGFLGYTGFSYSKTTLANIKKDIEDLKKQDCIVVINFHWGIERAYTPNETQKYLAHYAIDNGADLIIGHHPHVIQGIEKYKNKFILYSMGNFCFGGNSNPPDKDTFIAQTTFKVTDGKLTSMGIRVIPCSVSSVSNINDYCPTPLTGDKKLALQNKLNSLSINLGFKLSDDYNYINTTD